MRGPWHIYLESPPEGSELWRAQIVDQEIETNAHGLGMSSEAAIAACRDEWSRVLHEDFGPQDFVVTRVGVWHVEAETTP